MLHAGNLGCSINNSLDWPNHRWRSVNVVAIHSGCQNSAVGIYLIYNTQVSIHGTTFQGSGFRNILSLKDASHVVIKFIREDNQLYGMINFLDTPIGRGLKFASDIEYTLVPIYTSDKKLCFFDIDPNIKFIDGTESFHYTIK